LFHQVKCEGWKWSFESRPVSRTSQDEQIKFHEELAYDGSLIQPLLKEDVSLSDLIYMAVMHTKRCKEFNFKLSQIQQGHHGQIEREAFKRRVSQMPTLKSHMNQMNLIRAQGRLGKMKLIVI
jgi:hypothetical protein